MPAKLARILLPQLDAAGSQLFRKLDGAHQESLAALSRAREHASVTEERNGYQEMTKYAALNGEERQNALYRTVGNRRQIISLMPVRRRDDILPRPAVIVRCLRRIQDVSVPGGRFVPKFNVHIFLRFSV